MECVALEEVRRACGGLPTLQVSVEMWCLASHDPRVELDPMSQVKEEKEVRRKKMKNDNEEELRDGSGRWLLAGTW